MKAELRLMMALVVLVLLAGGVSGATITFNKSLDVPARDLTVTYGESNISLTLSNVGNYKIGENVGITVSGGVKDMKLVLFNVDKLSIASPADGLGSFFGTSGSIYTTIPADRFDPNCLGFCPDGGSYKIGPGIYALAVQNSDTDPPSYFIAKPVIISEYDLSVNPNTTQINSGSTINVMVNISKNGNPVSVAPNKVKLEFLKGTSTHFNGTAVATANTGVYEANLQIPSSASGNYQLYAAITTNSNFYQNYPETIGAASYSGTITITQASSTPAPTSTASTSAGGGGGGGGAVSGELFANIAKSESYDKDLVANTPVTYTFKTPELGLYEIALTDKENELGITLKVEGLKSTSNQVTVEAPGTVYKNINILASTKKMKEALIRFRVENSWLGSNSLAGSDVKMLHWDGSQWTPLETAQTTRDDKYTYYEAKTNGFSPFAIVGLKESGTVVQPTTQQTRSEVTAVATNTPAETSQQDTTGIFGLTYPIFVLIIALLTGILIVVSLRILTRKKR
ncbi:MAG: PGF-pre-PGF domain-containing protein [Candidatus Methanoperedens sp.]|nr:PGF-pre-PGF domain-containing protein [Candidatus Methanoperedens sp.]MCZ7406177.1 PGF-pre-PGF domain-containing protein [Candidatus Methanoperedens sp.]